MNKESISSLLKSVDRSLSFIQKPPKPHILTLTQDSRISELTEQIEYLTQKISTIDQNPSDRKIAQLTARLDDVTSRLVSSERRVDSLASQLEQISIQIDSKLSANLDENLQRMDGLARSVGKALRTSASKTPVCDQSDKVALAAMRAELDEYAKRFDAINTIIRKNYSLFCFLYINSLILLRLN